MRILFERSIIMGRCILPRALVLVDVSVDLVHQGRALRAGEHALDSQVCRFAIGLSQVKQQCRIRGKKQAGLAQLFQRRLNSAVIPQRPGKPGMCLPVDWFQSHSFYEMWDRQARLALLFVVDTQVEAYSGQAWLQLFRFAQGTCRLSKFSLCVVNQPETCIGFRHLGSQPDDGQVLLCREVKVACILCLVSCGEVLSRLRISILGPQRHRVKRGREDPKSDTSPSDD